MNFGRGERACHGVGVVTAWVWSQPAAARRAGCWPPRLIIRRYCRSSGRPARRLTTVRDALRSGVEPRGRRVDGIAVKRSAPRRNRRICRGAVLSRDWDNNQRLAIVPGQFTTPTNCPRPFLPTPCVVPEVVWHLNGSRQPTRERIYVHFTQ
jgi:hypothetical protein